MVKKAVESEGNIVEIGESELLVAEPPFSKKELEVMLTGVKRVWPIWLYSVGKEFLDNLESKIQKMIDEMD